jgi:acyl-coenzyme A thioesterase 9
MIGRIKNLRRTKSIFRSYETKIKQPRDSYIEKIYNFDTDIQLRDNYLNSFGYLRIGKILEDLDLFAGDVAYK